MEDLPESVIPESKLDDSTTGKEVNTYRIDIIW